MCLRLLSNEISIHALREEGDGSFTHIFFINGGFLSTPSARRATCSSSNRIWLMMVFLSTPSARRATAKAVIDILHYGPISIHALREEGDG